MWRLSNSIQQIVHIFLFIFVFNVFWTFGYSGQIEDYLVGDWGGDLQYYNKQCKVNIGCSFELLIMPDDLLIMRIGSACVSGGCETVGMITNFTSSTIEVIIPPCDGREHKPCICGSEPNGTTLCMTYSVNRMNMVISMYKDTEEMSICPNNVDKTCNFSNLTLREENVTQVGNLVCTDGECVRCRSLTTCNSRGVCNEDGTCRCFSGWAGNYCERSLCPGEGCSGHGLCDPHFTPTLYSPPPSMTRSSSKHLCKCIKPWVGEDCSSIDIFGGRESLWHAFAYAVIIPLSVSLMTCVFKYRDRGITLPTIVRGAWAYVNGESDEHNSDGEGSDDEIGDNNYNTTTTIVTNNESEGGGGYKYEEEEEDDGGDEEDEEEEAVEDICIENER